MRVFSDLIIVFRSYAMRTFLTNGYQNQSHVYSTCLDVHNNIFFIHKNEGVERVVHKGMCVYLYMCANVLLLFES